MMTVERRVLFGLADIRRIVFECVQCKAQISVIPEEVKNPPDSCPAGHAWDWNVGTGYHSTESPFRALLSSLAKLRDPLYEKMGFRILLEIAEP